ncbi:MAG: hypothetical protein AAGG69_00085 [Pseudomonadota bacterium]
MNTDTSFLVRCIQDDIEVISQQVDNLEQSHALSEEDRFRTLLQVEERCECLAQSLRALSHLQFRIVEQENAQPTAQQKIAQRALRANLIARGKSHGRKS